MSNQEFIDQIIYQYNNAKKLIVSGYETHIERGKKRSISGIAEDLFAVWLFKNLQDDSLKLMVDKPVSFASLRADKRTKTIQPDIVVARGETIIGYIDIKMDLGWNRDLEVYLKDKDQLIEDMRGKPCWTTYWKGNKSFTQDYSFSDNIIYQVVVLSSKNINEERLRANVQCATDCNNVKMYVLTEGQHLNVSEESQNRVNVERKDGQFEAILNDLKMQLADDFKGC